MNLVSNHMVKLDHIHATDRCSFAKRFTGTTIEHNLLTRSLQARFDERFLDLVLGCAVEDRSLRAEAQALGGRHYRQSPDGVTYVDQNFDTYAVEYTYADGSKFNFDGRCMTGCQDIYASYLHGTKGMAIASKSGDCGTPSSIFKSQNTRRSDMTWESKVNPAEGDPYLNEWMDLVDAIRNDKPYSEVKRGVEASLVTSMGRMAAHTGQEITFEDMLNCEHEMAPGLDKLVNESSDAPLKAGPDGRYPVPEPGRKRNREY